MSYAIGERRETVRSNYNEYQKISILMIQETEEEEVRKTYKKDTTRSKLTHHVNIHFCHQQPCSYLHCSKNKPLFSIMLTREKQIHWMSEET
jgi:hypothetical protein